MTVIKLYEIVSKDKEFKVVRTSHDNHTHATLTSPGK